MVFSLSKRSLCVYIQGHGECMCMYAHAGVTVCACMSVCAFVYKKGKVIVRITSGISACTSHEHSQASLKTVLPQCSSKEAHMEGAR